jgi:hypothetical protein
MLAHIDESGYARPNEASPWNTLVALCPPESSSRDLSRWLYSTVRAVYPAINPQNYEIKASELLNRRQFEQSAGVGDALERPGRLGPGIPKSGRRSNGTPLRTCRNHWPATSVWMQHDRLGLQ